MSHQRSGSAPSGIGWAGMTAAISGVAVFVNSYGVHSFPRATVYTTAKNLVAAVVLAVGAAVWRARKGAPAPAAGPGTGRGRRGGRGQGAGRWAGLAFVGTVGGGLAFALFFEGLAATSAVPAAFLRDTLVAWVALLALPFLGERPSGWNLAAIGLLVAGQAAAAGGVGHLAAGRGQLLVLAATLLWAVEVVVAKRLLSDMAPGRLALVRMGGGSVTLLVWLALTGKLAALADLTPGRVWWALATGVLLAGYVATWMAALSRGRAVDVTSVLVGSALVTALLGAAAGRSSLAPQAVGLALVAGGILAVLRGWPRRVPAPAGTGG